MKQSLHPNEPDFMTRLYFEYERLMFYIAGQYTPDVFLREEIVQTALLQLLQKQDMLYELTPAARAVYLTTTVRHTAMNRIKKERREQAHQISLEDAHEEVWQMQEISCDLYLVQMEDRHALLRALDALSEEDRFLLAGKYILRLDDPALAQQLACKPGSIRMKLTRARKTLLKKLKWEEAVR